MPRRHPFVTGVRSASALVVLLLAFPACDRTSGTVAIGTLRINEVMARNRDFDFVDGNGAHLDWAEIYNPGTGPVSLSGWSLTDNPGRPMKYEFPADLVLDPGEFVVVFLASAGDEADFVAEALPGESRVFLRSRFHAPFALNQLDDRLHLYAGGGAQLVDAVEIHRLAQDISAGRYPDGGREFGPIYAATPGAENGRVGVKPLRWSRLPRLGEPAEPCGEVPIVFDVVQDVADGNSPPVVTVEWAPLSTDCGSERAAEFVALSIPAPLVSERAEDSPCASLGPGAIVDPDDGCRRDASGEVVLATLRTFSYEVRLPPGECTVDASGDLIGPSVAYRLLVEDESRILEIEPRCYTYGQATPTLVVNEYQPRNGRTIFFICETCDESDCCLASCANAPCGIDDCLSCDEVEGIGVRRIRSPDWIEVYNFGDEPIDLTRLGLGGDPGIIDPDDPQSGVERVTWEFGADTGGDPFMTTIGPGEYRLVLADADDGANRRAYRRVERRDDGVWVADESRVYYSTPFRLDPTRRTIDSFVLGSIDGAILDRVELDFRQYAADNGLALDDTFLVDAAVGRFPDDDPSIPPDAVGRARYPADILRPGIVTPCPTPDGVNLLVCDVPPSFDLAASSFPRCPDADETVLVRGRIALDDDGTVEYEVRVVWRSSDGSSGVLSSASGGVEVEPAATVFGAPPGTSWFDIAATLPAQPAGVVIEWGLEADVTLESSSGERREFSARLDRDAADDAGATGLSFVFAVGAALPVTRPIVSEVLPRNRSLGVPGFAVGSFPDYLELTLAEGGADEIDLGGYYLTDANGLEADGVVIAEPRRWPFPAGTTIRRGEYLLLVFRQPAVPTPGVIQVSGFDLDGCGETVHIIGPDDEGNCVVETFSWWGDERVSCLPDQGGGGETGVDDLAYGLLCGGGVGLLTAPTPLAPNSLAPLVVGASHRSIFPIVANPCLAPNASFQIVVEVLLDRSITTPFVTDAFIELDDGTLLSGAVRGASLPSSYPARFEVPEPCVGAAEPCYQARVLEITTRAPADLEERGVVRYRPILVDTCGGVLEPCPPGEFCFSFGSASTERPDVVISEICRFSALPGSQDVRRPWIELHNRSAEVVDLTGWSLSNRAVEPRLAMLPDGASIEPGGFLIVITDGRANLPGPDAPPHVVVDLPWAQVFKGELRKCRLFGELSLFDRVENGSCLVSAFPFEFPEVSTDRLACGTPGAPNYDPDCTDCDSTSMGLIDSPPAIVHFEVATPGAPNVTIEPGSEFVRGDADANGILTVADAVAILRFLFGGDGSNPCPDALDTDDSGGVEVTDGIAILDFLFRSGSAPPPPFPAAGVDPTDDDLGCARD